MLQVGGDGADGVVAEGNPQGEEDVVFVIGVLGALDGLIDNICRDFV